ncbi:MAG: Sjogren's syndrome/scleroderma autoantigen 1 family protein [Candidatus Hydrothermarchaeales archaeon]
MEKLEERMVELLLSRAKMLRQHCPKCKSPLFEKGGKIICPACGVFEKGKAVSTKDKKTGKKKPKTKKKDKKSDKIIKKKRDELLKRLVKETKPDKIVNLTEAVKKMDHLLGAEQNESQ